MNPKSSRTSQREHDALTSVFPGAEGVDLYGREKLARALQANYPTNSGEAPTLPKDRLGGIVPLPI